MAATTSTVKPLLSLSLSTNQTKPPSYSSFISCKPIPISDSISTRPRLQVSVSVSFNPQGNFDLSLLEEDDDNLSKVAPPMPPTEGRFEVTLDNETISSLDLSPFHSATGITSPSLVEPKEFLERTIGFTINYTREDPRDPRELSEFPDIRLWFVRLDAAYPWLPVLLDWRAGELARYAAMLVPHQMSMKMGIVYNPEALEIFIVKKVFVVYNWLKQHNVPKPRIKTKDMARMLGFGIEDQLFDLVDKFPLEPS
ncbi:Chlororespiratory reduction 6 [Melia azedarach]|uniref:Chlororespiratory reduction 6 n=1 Tax=Melia azedarach TaxID=155640 RepID=A0ACC1XFU1_MELAZ|nr:Chlororespiratory reduction 6 [Melia azedarach]